jgi:hypothetical protein
MPSGNKLPSRPHKQRIDLDTLISKIDNFLSLPIPKPEKCGKMSDEGYLLLKELDKHFRFYLDVYFDGSLTKDKFTILGVGTGEYRPKWGEFISKEAKEGNYYQKKRIIKFADKLAIRCDELSERSLPWKYLPVSKPLLESPKRPFDKKLKKPLAELRKFLRNDKVIGVLKKFKTIEDSTFVVFILLPLIHFDIYEGEGVKMEKSFIMTKPLADAKTSINEIIMLLSIHFKRCLGGEHYDWIADLLCLAQGEKWTGGRVKMRLQRLKKSGDWNQKVEYFLPNWKEYYPRQPPASKWEGYYRLPNWEAHYLYKSGDYKGGIRESSGLNELVRRSLPNL